MLKIRHFLDRNLVLQNETMDEDLEHFRDVTEDDDDQTNAIEIRMAQAVHDTNKNSNGNGTDSDLSASQDDSTPPDSEGYDSDEANDLLMADDQDDIKESRLIADNNKLPSEVTDFRSTFPGGYNLRHREPLYWYLNIIPCSVGIYKHTHRHLLHVYNWQLCSVLFFKTSTNPYLPPSRLSLPQKNKEKRERKKKFCFMVAY